jgi:hypothetical protein
MPKAALFPTVEPSIIYGDGCPLDVGTDRQLAVNVNEYIDRKSAHQNPILLTSPQSGFGIGDTTVNPAYCAPRWFGFNLNSATVKRVLSVAPLFQSASGSTVGVIVAIGDAPPAPSPGYSPISNPVFAGPFSQATWTTTSTTLQTGTPASLDIVKDLNTGLSWLYIGVYGSGRVFGLGRCIEGVRTII